MFQLAWYIEAIAVIGTSLTNCRARFSCHVHGGPAQQILHASRGGQGDACMANAAVCPAQVVGGAWLFSRLYCNIFVTLDVMMCTASILNLCAISIDRWVHVYLWILWRRKRTFFPLLMSNECFYGILVCSIIAGRTITGCRTSFYIIYSPRSHVVSQLIFNTSLESLNLQPPGIQSSTILE